MLQINIEVQTVYFYIDSDNPHCNIQLNDCNNIELKLAITTVVLNNQLRCKCYEQQDIYEKVEILIPYNQRNKNKLKLIFYDNLIKFGEAIFNLDFYIEHNLSQISDRLSIQCDQNEEAQLTFIFEWQLIENQPEQNIQILDNCQSTSSPQSKEISQRNACYSPKRQEKSKKSSDDNRITHQSYIQWKDHKEQLKVQQEKKLKEPKPQSKVVITDDYVWSNQLRKPDLNVRVGSPPKRFATPTKQFKKIYCSINEQPKQTDLDLKDINDKMIVVKKQIQSMNQQNKKSDDEKRKYKTKLGSKQKYFQQEEIKTQSDDIVKSFSDRGWKQKIMSQNNENYDQFQLNTFNQVTEQQYPEHNTDPYQEIQILKQGLHQQDHKSRSPPKTKNQNQQVNHSPKSKTQHQDDNFKGTKQVDNGNFGGEKYEQFLRDYLDLQDKLQGSQIEFQLLSQTYQQLKEEYTQVVYQNQKYYQQIQSLQQQFQQKINSIDQSSQQVQYIQAQPNQKLQQQQQGQQQQQQLLLQQQQQQYQQSQQQQQQQQQQLLQQQQQQYQQQQLQQQQQQQQQQQYQQQTQQNQQYQNQQSQNQQYLQQLSQQQQNIDFLKKENELIQRENTMLKQNYELLQQNLQVLQHEKEKNEFEIQNHKNSLKILNQELENLQKKLDLVNNQQQSHVTPIQANTAKFDLRTDIQQINQLKTKLENSELISQGLREELNSLKQSYVQQEKESQNLKKQVDNQSQMIESLEEEIQRSKEQLEQKKQEIIRLEAFSNKENTNDVIDGYKQVVRNKQQELNNKDEEIKQLKQRNKQLESEYKEEQENNQIMVQQLNLQLKQIITRQSKQLITVVKRTQRFRITILVNNSLIIRQDQEQKNFVQYCQEFSFKPSMIKGEDFENQNDILQQEVNQLRQEINQFILQKQKDDIKIKGLSEELEIQKNITSYQENEQLKLKNELTATEAQLLTQKQKIADILNSIMIKGDAKLMDGLEKLIQNKGLVSLK
ncbi:unnamed protein product (macronuclear) [Paramecium tetraurelia]|uniref:C2 NT-type domain-containing protein n=1 Tax=Paramecium tetraurelia TaxID=5888 RepID=A0DRW8_PARTE|nr:uncharacterized protein GSPATT00019489001 [Paramecium tetraurelia]CAK85785.1 unnamed protein product [Paramecium tetraurelia]|eukprot:XP_001453182.1 hypothetical protein (macronuclear) [Paramecium tetraurelia strain d4-2]